MRRVVLVGIVAACASALPVMAGSAEDPEVTDPVGDVQHLGAPVPAGFEWSDITSAWFEAPDNESLTLHIEVVGRAGPPAQGEVGVTFEVGTRFFIAGWTVVPGLYSGGFLSASEQNGDVPSSVSPSTAEATWTGSDIMITIPLGTVDPNGTIGRLSDPNGWSESRATNGRMWRLDETAIGKPFNWSSPAPTEGPAGRGAPDGTNDAPGFTGLGALAGLAIAALAAGSRRGLVNQP